MNYSSVRRGAFWGLGLSVALSLSSCFPSSSTPPNGAITSNPVAATPSAPHTEASQTPVTNASDNPSTELNSGPGTDVGASNPGQTSGSGITGSEGVSCSPLVSISSVGANGKNLSTEFTNPVSGYMTVTSTLSCSDNVKSVQYMYRLVPEGEFMPLGTLQTADNNYRYEINTQVLLSNGQYELITRLTLKDGNIRLSAPLAIQVDNAGSSSSGGGGGGGGSSSGGSSGGGGGSTPGNVNFNLDTSFSVPAGTSKWSLDLGAQVSSSPLIDAEGNSFFAAGSNFYIYNASGVKTGEVALSKEVTAPAARAGNFVYFGDTNGNLVKVDISDPSNPTKVDISLSAGQGFEYNMPAIDCTGNVYIQTKDRKLFKVDSNGNKTQLLSIPDPTAGFPIGSTVTARYASPVIYNNQVFTGSQNGIRIANLDGTNPIAFIPSQTCYSGLGCDNAAQPLDQAMNSPLAVDGNGLAYVVSETGTLFQFDPTDGSEKNRTFVGDGDAAPVIGSDGTVYVASENGILLALDANLDELFTIGLGNVVEFSSPAIGKGPDGEDVIYVGTEGGLLYSITGTALGTSGLTAGTQRFVKSLGAPIRSDISIGNDGTVYVGTLDGRMYTLFGDSVGLADSAWPKAQRDLDATGIAGSCSL